MNTDSTTTLRVLDSGNILDMLFEKAASNLTKAELKHLATGSFALAEDMARRTGDIAEGLGLAIESDQTDGVPGAGTFREPDDVANLAYQFASSFRHIAGLLRVAEMASDSVRQAEARS